MSGEHLPRIVIGSVTFDSGRLSEALKLPVEAVITAFQDGRGAWPFSELWGERLYEFVKHSNSNNPVSDGVVALAQLRDVSISVKALTRSGIKFQQSKFVGSGRSSTKEGLLSSLEACDRVVVVDITGFPEVLFIPIEATRLLSAAHRDVLTVNGWSKDRLYDWLGQTYRVSTIQLALE